MTEQSSGLDDRILIVDDSVYNIYVLEELIASISANIKVDKALNGVEALEKVVELYNSK